MSTLATPAPAVPATPRLTVEQFVARHATGRVELVEGVVKELPMPGFKHGVVCLLIGRLIGGFVEANRLGLVASNDSWVRTGTDTVRGGDICFVRQGRLPEGSLPEGVLPVPPDLVVEVKAPSDRWIDRFTKVVEYLRAGVRVVVLVDPEKSTASVYREDQQEVLGVNDTLALPDVLPGFSVPVARLFG